jgi:hypothetical protein
METTVDSKSTGMPASAGSPVAKSSRVCGMVKKRSSKDKMTTLRVHFGEILFISVIN